MASINKPPILDETGQAILSELERLTAIAGPPGKDYVLTSADKEEIAGLVTLSVEHVQVDGTSILSDGVANVPLASTSAYGVLMMERDEDAKFGLSTARAVTPARQEKSTFYGLAKAAGDTTQSQSSNPVGTYTEAAQSAIHDMLNAPVTVSGSTPSITAKSGIHYVCGEVSTISITPCASGTCEVQFTSGTTATVLTASGVTWPEWFDATSLETERIYDVLITDGTLGMVMSWPA